MTGARLACALALLGGCGDATDHANPDGAAASPSVWIAGDGVLLRWDGGALTEATAPAQATWYALWGAGADDVWLGGGGSALYHFDGASWRAQAKPGLAATIYGLSGSATDDVWAVGGDSHRVILHWDGKAWANLGSDNAAAPLAAVSTVARDRAWAAGGSGILEWDAGAWATSPAAHLGYSGIWANARDSFFVVDDAGDVEHYTGIGRDAWVPLGGQALTAVSGVSLTDVWVVGPVHAGVAALAHFDGAEWTRFDAPRQADLAAVFARAGDDVWAVGDGAVFHFDGKTWHDVPGAPAKKLLAVWGG